MLRVKPSNWPSSYPVIYPASFDRRDWIELRLGWKLADNLLGPHLVFPTDRPVFRLEEDLERARARFFELRTWVARAPELKKDYPKVLKQISVAWRGLVRAAVGYTYPEEWDVMTFGRPVRVLWAFDIPTLEES